MEGSHASGLIRERGQVRGIRSKADQVNGHSGGEEYRALVSIDATGRHRSLARHVEQTSGSRKRQRPTLVAFKAHLENATVGAGACEIYFYKGGYGGLSGVEGGVSNLCFIVAADDVRHYSSDPETVLREVVMKNVRAAETLKAARARSAWLSVSLEGFGKRALAPADGLLTIGDAAAFIDPFTGSGMLMALESGTGCRGRVARHLPRFRAGWLVRVVNKSIPGPNTKTRFNSRLQVSGLLRRAAFVPGLAEAAILLCGTSSRLRRKLARATRHPPVREPELPPADIPGIIVGVALRGHPLRCYCISSKV
jgi:flavin-dependent dehydrogenase